MLRMQLSEILLSSMPEAALESAQESMPSNAVKGSYSEHTRPVATFTQNVSFKSQRMSLSTEDKLVSE